MIDTELLRNNPDILKEEVKKRGLDIDVDSDVKLDEKRRSLIFQVDQ